MPASGSTQQALPLQPFSEPFHGDVRVPARASHSGTGGGAELLFCGRLPGAVSRRRETCISTQSESRALLVRALPRPIGGGLWQALWRGRSVRAQLLIVFILIDVVAGLIAGAVTILHARTSTRVEIAASMQLARLLVSEAVALMQQEVPAEKFLADLTSQLRLVRHVRIVVKDAAGLPLAVPAAAPAREPVHEAQAPAWFAALIAPEIESRHVPVVVKGQRIGSVEIVAEPSDEIAEVWTNSVALGAVALLVNVAVIGMLYFLFGRVLDPLAGVARGLGDLEQRNYRVRLPRPQARELAVITDRFNALAHALEAARSENDQLNHRLISAQDDERRRTARELHDEVGPCLFGLKANAGSIQTAAAALPDPVGGKLVERARDMLAIIEQLQVINRSLLNRLRPMALGHFPLRDILAELVNESARRDPRIAFSPDRRCARPQLRRFHRSHDLPMPAGKPDQHRPACAGDARAHRARRKRGDAAVRARRTMPAPERSGRRMRFRPCRAVAGLRHPRHAGTRSRPGRPLHLGERARARHLRAHRHPAATATGSRVIGDRRCAGTRGHRQ